MKMRESIRPFHVTGILRILVVHGILSGKSKAPKRPNTEIDVCCSLRCYGCYYAINSAPEYGSDLKCKSDELVAHEPEMVKECYGEDQQCYVKESSSNGAIHTFYRGCESTEMCQNFPTILHCCGRDMCNGVPPRFSLHTSNANPGSRGNTLAQNHGITITTAAMSALIFLVLGR